ncbi:FkbM family methyltransferase [Rhodopirellula rubra]|uniref:FkbM family methyltransferase n=1 Tax=Aporhodopirellula rubra TaxID=980271 RepID=A0A7W5DY85_9BACT|nr:FkbM family methyltransferase [Aporhodopirellula rubra]MBB3206293.1 FkbM family methyltransferase [Aporhodopirellula rubra]
MTDSVSLQPTQITESMNDWSTSRPFFARIAQRLNRWLPRGKGAVPRWIGRCFGKDWKFFIQTDSGCHLAVDPGNLDLFVTIQNEGAWEPWVRQACILAVGQSDVFLDVGANAGTISNEVGRARSNARIYSFEPQPDMARLVALSATKNGLSNITVFEAAVGDHCGTVILHKPAHTLHASTKSVSTGHEERIECPLITIDAMVASGQLPPPDVVKIDVEGGELDVLKGAEQTLQENMPIVIFEANENCERYGYTRSELIRTLRNAGDYQFFQIAPGDVMAIPTVKAAAYRENYPQLVEN